MERQLPKYTIDGTDFLVDVMKAELRQTDNPANTIPFIDMDEFGMNYVLGYNRKTKNMTRPLEPGEEIEISIPQMIYLDPEGMAEKYGLTIAQLKNKLDFDLVNEPELLEKRMAGELPRINIAGLDYEVDVKLRELRPEGNPEAVIKLRQMDAGLDPESYMAYFHTPSRRIIEIDPGITKLPKDVVAIVIPDEFRLDPYGVAQKKKMDHIEMRAMLRRYPQPKELTAKVIPLLQTELPGLIQRNKAQLKQKQNKGLRP